LDADMRAGNWQVPDKDDLARVRAMMRDPGFHDRIANVPEERLNAAIVGEDDSAFWVYHADGRARAYVLMTELGSTLPKIDEFAVFDRGRGYGKAALRALVRKVAATPGFEKVWLNVVTDNVAAIALYEAIGFGDAQFIPRGWTNSAGVTVDLYRMFLPLDRLRADRAEK
jgi:RimJ/RimL family protein N-acetyltransferase